MSIPATIWLRVNDEKNMPTAMKDMPTNMRPRYDENSIPGTIVPGAQRFKAIALTDNVPLITAWANDTEYANVFVEQLDPLVEAGDVVIGISGSGNSENVLRAMRLAKAREAHTIGFTGASGGKLAYLVDVNVVARGAPMEMAEDVHMFLDHLICTTLREVRRREQ